MTAQTKTGSYGWAPFAGLVTTVTALDLAACLYFLLHGDLGVLLRAPVGVLCGYWIAMRAVAAHGLGRSGSW